MLPIKSQTWFHGIVMGLALVFTLSLSASTATGAPLPDPGPGPRFQAGPYVVTDALPSAVSGRTNSSQHQITGGRMPTAGPLIYQDLKKVEEEARSLLAENKEFRIAISPHNEKPDFAELVQKFDYESGFDKEYTGTQTLQDMLDIADSELRQARDLYAYLAVYADWARFRDDSDGDCKSLADDPFADPPVIDWCDFAARMRESLREATYLRMIFGQQFTADALGFRFGANIVGGEDFVRDEVRQLEMAEEQFQLAHEAVTEGLDYYLGNGCYVSDFYTQAEWVLLSRAVEGLERARHHIAVRKSYLAPDESGLPDAELQAVNVFRAGAMDQYIDTILTANLAAGQSQCARGTRPDNDLVAKMVADLLSTRQSSREMQEGRNAFGFDVSFIPARPYRTAPGSPDEGLWKQAGDTAELAKDLQDDATNAERWFDRQENELLKALADVKLTYDYRLGSLTGCSTSLPDEDFFDCVDTADDRLRACDPTTIETAEDFNTCVDGTGVGGQLKEAWENVFTAFLEVKRVQKALDNLAQSQIIEQERNATVRHEIMTNGQDQALMEYFATLLDSYSGQITMMPPSVSMSNNPFFAEIAALRSGQKLRQAVAEMKIENANSEAVVRNLVLDVVELQIALEIAAHKANAQGTVFENLASGTKDLAVEARRARAYAAQSPANDPSFRLVRDSVRLQLADQLELAARIGYLAAKRAEYEYAARLSASNFRISDIYRARTAQDILVFLNDLENITNSLVVGDAEIDREEFTLSVAQHVLGWTDEELGLTGNRAYAERVRRFREWVAENTSTGKDGKPVLVFSITTSAADNGVFSNVIAQGYDRFWLHKVGGIGQPKPASNGFGMNLITSQKDDLVYRRVAVTQSGLVHLKARSGCLFEYRLIHPAALLGMEWPGGQPSDVATATFKAGINGQNGTRTAAFLGRPVSATDWQVIVYAGAPETGLPDMYLQQLEDIELVFDSTHGSRAPGVPDLEDCVRIDY